jgi:hypothetical protein
MEYHPVVHRALTLNAASYHPEYHPAAAYQPASLHSLASRPFAALPTVQQQPPMQPYVNPGFQQHQSVVRPRPYPAPYSDPFNTQTPREASVPAFYNYRPNEVKHRKRTTRAQTKILEEQFKSTDKPDAATRNDLSIRLGMTPREVQVWFQNRRAKEKKLRAQALAALNQDNEQLQPSTPENEASSRALSPSAPTDAGISRALTQSPPNPAETPQLVAELASTLAMADSASRSSDDLHSLSTVQNMQNNDRGKPLDLISVQPLTLPMIPTLPRVVSAPLISTAGVSQSSSAPATSIDTTPFMGFPITTLAHRGSLPHIRPAPYTVEQTHQRSASSPVFTLTPPSSVSENPSPSGTVPSFSQTPPRYNPTAAYSKAHSYVFPSRNSQTPVSGPLPNPNYSFGAPVHAEVENGEEDGTVPYVQYRSPRFGSIASITSVAGSDTTSKSAASLLTTDATHPTFEDDTSAFTFNAEQKRPSSSNAIPSASTSLSPWSGTFSSASPMSAASYSQTVSQPAQENGLYVDYGASYENDPPVVASRQIYAPTPTKADMAFQNAMYGYGDNVVVAQSTADDALVQYAGSEMAAPFQSYAPTHTYDASSAVPQQPSIAQYTTQGLDYDTNALAMQQSYGYPYNTDLYNNQYGAPLELYDA